MQFSIAIPVLGKAVFVATALKSIQAQRASFQLAIMDATTDLTIQKILRKYDDIIDYSRHGPDEGQSVAIEEGWKNTKGDILTWLCADDYYFPTTLQEVSKVFKNAPDVDVVYGDSVYVDEEGRFKMYFPSICKDVSEIIRNCCVAQPSCFVHRRAMESIGGLNTELNFVMDWDLWMRLYKSGAKFKYIEKPLSVTRVYKDTKTSSMALERYREINNLLKKNVDFLNRVKSLLGFVSYDVVYGVSHNTMARYVLKQTTKLRTFLRTKVGKRGRKKKWLYGLEAWTNIVSGECEVFLPSYNDNEERRLYIETNDLMPLMVKVNGEEFGAVEPETVVVPYRYILDISKIKDRALDIVLSGKGGNKEWQLLSVYEL